MAQPAVRPAGQPVLQPTVMSGEDPRWSENEGAVDAYRLSTGFPVRFLRRETEAKYVEELQHKLLRGARRFPTIFAKITVFFYFSMFCAVILLRVVFGDDSLVEVIPYILKLLWADGELLYEPVRPVV